MSLVTMNGMLRLLLLAGALTFSYASLVSATLQLEREMQALDAQLAAPDRAAALVRQKSDARRRHNEHIFDRG